MQCSSSLKLSVNANFVQQSRTPPETAHVAHRHLHYGLRGCDTPNLYDKVIKSSVLVSQDQRNHKVSTMIHLQVHLQIPCYDFYPVQAIAIELFPAIPRPEGLDTAVRSPLETAQSRTATGGVYKWQGRNQRELMTHTY